MTTPQPPRISVSIVAPPAPLPTIGSDTVFLVGPGGTGATLTPGTPSVAYANLAAAQAGVGTTGAVYEALVGLYGQVSLQTIVSLTPDKTSTLGAALTAAATAVTVADGSKFAAGDTLVLGDEEMTVSSIAGNVLTVVRGANGTTAETHESGDSVEAPPTDAQVRAALHSVRRAALTPTVLYAPGLTAGIGGRDTVANGVISNGNTQDKGLNELAEELGCRAVADACQTSVADAIAWAGNNRQANVMGIFNSPDQHQPGGYWLGGALAVTGAQGLSQGIEHAPVTGVTALANALSHSPRAAVMTDVSRLVGAYLSVLVSANGRTEIIGDTFYQSGAAPDSRRYWSVARVLDELERLLSRAGQPFIGRGNTQAARIRIANALERAGRQLVASGDLEDFSVMPDDVRNTSAAEMAGQAFFLGEATTVVPLETIQLAIGL